MKKTSSMIYRPTAESDELYLFAANDRRIYDMISYVLKNLEKKAAKGIYDAEKAVIAFYHVATAAATEYGKQYGGKFTVTERWSVACDLLDLFAEDINA